MQNKLTVVINMENRENLPRNFRMTEIPYQQDEVLPLTAGLSELRASASGQFSEKSFEKMLQVVPSEKIYIVDLRQEYHGFINGIAVSWYTDKNWSNRDKNLKEIVNGEKRLLEKAKNDRYITLYEKHSNFKNPRVVTVNEAYTEEDLARQKGINYIRIPTTDHLKPPDKEVDEFIHLVKSQFLDKHSDCWIHFHCSAGRGRTTTFLSMYDMMRNAHAVSFDDILARQALIGGKDLTEPFDISDWRYEHHFERLKFLADFYKYCIENPNFEQSWSSWTQSV